MVLQAPSMGNGGGAGSACDLTSPTGRITGTACFLKSYLVVNYASRVTGPEVVTLYSYIVDWILCSQSTCKFRKKNMRRETWLFAFSALKIVRLRWRYPCIQALVPALILSPTVLEDT